MASGDQYGPALPPGMVAANDSASQSSEETSRKSKILGPCLPAGMQKSADGGHGQNAVKMESEISSEYTIQDDDDDDDDDDENEDDEDESQSIGPMPSDIKREGEDAVHTAEEFERRSKRMKDKLTVKAEAEEGPVKREEWMTELPPEMGKNFGLHSRTFSKGGHSEETKDRSSWTDTPSASKEKESNKGKKRKLEDGKAASARDNQLHQQVENYNKSKRPESLMDMHAKKLKKKKKKEKKEKKKGKEKDEKPARRPFDREKDFHAHQFDEAQRKLLIKRSQQLNSRFAHGSTTSHFL